MTRERLAAHVDDSAHHNASTSSAAARYLARLNEESSRELMSQRLDVAAQALGFTDWRSAPWHSLTDADTSTIISKLTAAGHRPAEIGSVLRAVHGVARVAYMQHQIDRATYDRIVRVRLEAGASVTTGRYVLASERDAIMRNCLDDRTNAGRRDAAIIACGYPGGLRRAEIAALDVADVTDDGLFVYLHVRGRNDRSVPLTHGAAQAIRDWLTVRGDSKGPLFWPGNRGGYLERDKRITAQSIYEMLKRRARQAGIEDVTIQDMRRSVTTDLLRVADSAVVGDYLGHRAVRAQPAHHEQREQGKKDAARKLRIAYPVKETPPASAPSQWGPWLQRS